MGIEKLEFAGFEVVLDSSRLAFDESTLNDYIQTEASHYDNFGHYLALAEKNLQNREVFYERIYNERFVEAKEAGGSDKLAEAKAKADPDVLKTKEEIIEARYVVNRLKRHLGAWDKNHDNAQSLGHMLRKSMDKLNAEIMAKAYHVDMQEVVDLDKTIAETVMPVPEGDPEFESDLDSSNLF